MEKVWYKVQPKSSADSTSPVDVYIFNEIGVWGVGAQDFIKEIKEYTKFYKV